MATTTKEIWKDIPYLKGQTVNKYVVSNLGRVATYTDHIKELTILQPSLVDNMYRIIIRIKNKSKSLYPYQAVAAVFLKQPKTTQKHLIHLDYDKTNNVVANLKWVTNEEYYEYRTKNPNVPYVLKTRLYTGTISKKLNEQKVIQLKKEIWNPKRKLSMKQIADKYGIAEMNLYRIKSGVLWHHVHVEGEPITEKYKQHLKNLAILKKLTDKENQEKVKKEAAKKAQQKKNEQKRKEQELEKKKRAEALAKRQLEKEKQQKTRVKKEKKQDKKVKKSREKKRTDKKVAPVNYTLVKITKKKKRK